MSMDDFTACMRGEYNQDEEAVKFIIHIYELGGESAVTWLKDNWAKIAAASGLIAAIAKYGGESALVKFLQPIVGAAIGAAIDVLGAMLLGLGVAVVGLAIIAAVSCLPKIEAAMA